MATEIQKIRNAVELQLKQTDKVIASTEAVTDIISGLDDTLASGFSMLGGGLQELCFITEDGFREIIDRLDLQSKTLNAIKEILERPLDTQAKELRKRAEVAYLNNWFDEAEMDLLEAEKKNYQDFVVHHILGNIYYHHKKNYQKALEYYQKAAKYASPMSKKHSSNALICAAMVYYKLGRLQDGYKSTKTAIELMPEDKHVLYNNAKYAARMGYSDEFVDCLTRSIVQDSTYLIAADRDEMFSDVRKEVEKLKENLMDSQRKKLDYLKKRIASAKETAESVGIKDFTSLDNKLTEVNKLYRQSYFELLKAESTARKAYEESVEEWVKLKNDVITKIEQYRNRIMENMTLQSLIPTIICTYLIAIALLIIDAPKRVGISDVLLLVFAPIAIPLGGLGILLSGGKTSIALIIALISLGIPLITFFTTKGIIETKLTNIRNKIKKENSAIARLSNLKKENGFI